MALSGPVFDRTEGVRHDIACVQVSYVTDPMIGIACVWITTIKSVRFTASLTTAVVTGLAA